MNSAILKAKRKEEDLKRYGRKSNHGSNSFRRKITMNFILSTLPHIINSWVLGPLMTYVIGP